MYDYNMYHPNIPAYPQRYPTYPQVQTQMPINNFVSGRIVSGIEEARAAQIALDGTPSYFPSLGEGKIYVKYIGMDGSPVFQTFVVEPLKPQVQGLTLEALAERVQRIENAIQNGGVNNAQPDATNGNVTAQQ